MIWMWYMLGCSVALVIEGDWQGKKVEGSVVLALP